MLVARGLAGTLIFDSRRLKLALKDSLPVKSKRNKGRLKFQGSRLTHVLSAFRVIKSHLRHHKPFGRKSSPEMEKHWSASRTPLLNQLQFAPEQKRRASRDDLKREPARPPVLSGRTASRFIGITSLARGEEQSRRESIERINRTRINKITRGETSSNNSLGTPASNP